MKTVIALLFGLSTIAFADEDGEEFSWDSGDDDTPSGTYDGIVVQVYNPTDGEPTITLGTSADNHENVYCLNLIRTFEAIGYDLTQTTSTDDDYTEVDGSSVDLKDANCEVTETSSTTFTVGCTGINGGDLDFDFTFISNTDGNDGLEYTISLENYEFVSDDPDAQLVLVQSVEECSDKYSYSGESGDDSEDDDDDEDSADTDDDSMVTRRLQAGESTTEEPETTDSDDDMDDNSMDDDGSDDSDDSEESDDGVSSDDSDEFDAGFSQFIADGQAIDRCDDGDTNIDSQLIYDEDEDELHIVFNHFDCTLFIDPKFTLDEDKIGTSSGASSMFIFIGLICGLLGALLV